MSLGGGGVQRTITDQTQHKNLLLNTGYKQKIYRHKIHTVFPDDTFVGSLQTQAGLAAAQNKPLWEAGNTCGTTNV